MSTNLGIGGQLATNHHGPSGAGGPLSSVLNNNASSSKGPAPSSGMNFTGDMYSPACPGSCIMEGELPGSGVSDAYKHRVKGPGESASSLDEDLASLSGPDSGFPDYQKIDFSKLVSSHEESGGMDSPHLASSFDEEDHGSDASSGGMVSCVWQKTKDAFEEAKGALGGGKSSSEPTQSQSDEARKLLTTEAFYLL
eukprot:TRINITY_DN1721_c0_g1_i1.p1 TRINITY_DN1721_c0_g1~~TRINITY_DN1721_c0_g1_i1.p1  ORF type:complete len:196 (+),score=34.22 TRINITY_DN1721_c0_g1_i1:44-631(+)